MEPSYEQASEFLDQAILSYSGGQIEEAYQHMAAAAAVLRAIQPAAQPQPEPAAIQEMIVEFPAITAYEMPPPVTTEPPVTAIQPATIEPAREPSLVAAA